MEMDPNALSLVAPGGQFVHTEKNFRPSESMKPYSRELGSGLSFSVPTRREHHQICIIRSGTDPVHMSSS
jgi:hypothetical protein